MYRNILMPLAYAPGHRPVAETAAAKAIAAPGAKVLLLHVIGPVPEFTADHFPAGAGTELAHVVEHDLARVAEDFMDARVRVETGDPVERILAVAAETGADCIVLAPHRSDRGVYGSTASEVARQARCAVHLVR